jgi:hypothetical protein
MLDKDAGSWFIVDSSAVGYDGVQNVRDEEHPVERKEPNRKQGEETKQSRWGFRGMTVRDWLQLLIVPVALVVIGFLFTLQQDARQQAIEDQRAQQAQKIENQRAEAERELAEQRAQDEALQAYFDQMSGLLLERDLRESEEDSEVRTLARARTLTVLERVGPSRKTAVMQFLVEAELVQRVGGRGPIITLTGADLRNTDLQVANLSGANLSDADLTRADVDSADLRFANLSNVDLEDASVFNADLGKADLSYADLTRAELSSTNLNGADLSYANLIYADLSRADLGKADLSRAWLDRADLSNALGITNTELEQQAETLEGATMPNGQKYEDWLKDKEGPAEG